MTSNALPRVVLVDDDPLFLKTFAANVERAGYRVTPFERSHEALPHLLRDPPDACILDWHMPGLDGLDLLRQLKAASFAPPIMFLTSLSQPLFEETALAGGAVEFVEKTRTLPIILKRLELMLARHKIAGGGQRQSGLAIGHLALDREAKRARWRDTEVPFSLGEFEVVALVAQKAGADVSYRQIYDVIQDVNFVSGRGPEGYRANVRAAIKRIRKKFAAIDPAFDALKNYPGFGYRWIDE
jgi:two-component system response regulator ChvI